MSSSTLRPASPAERVASPAGDIHLRLTQRWEVHGDVRGVGFRPFVRRVATELGLDGVLRTGDGGLRIDVAGPPQVLAAFRRVLTAHVPPHALVTDVVATTPHGLEPAPGTGFSMEPTAEPRLPSGSRIVWRAPGGGRAVHGHQAVAAAVALVDAGGVVAVHDEDGHHLVCDATQPRAVAVLRGRRCDWARPLPVMVSDREVARCLATLTADEERLLMASGCPIVLATARRSKPPLAAGVNPVGDRVGLCLPSTPLQHLLVDMLDRPLVVTEDGAVGLAHGGDDAPVGTLVVGDPDDRKAGPAAVSSRSVAWVVDGRPALLRRGRGEASVPLRLPVPACQPMLAMGADGTFALAKGEWAYVVEPDARSVRPTLDERLDHVRRCLDVAPEVVVQDLHPDDLSTKLASRWPRSCRVAVQHHHAHVAACAAEHDIDEAFVGVAYDSPRLGDDGTLWGGEVLVGDLRAAYRRAGRFAAAPLPGGLPALRRPARVALGYLLAGERLGNASVPSALVESYLRRLPAREVETVRRMTDTGVNSPLTSSAAALVGAVACLLGLKEDTSFDSEAGLALEAAARGQRAEELPWRVVDHDDVRVYDPSLTVAALLAGLRDGAPVSALAAGFHATMASVTVALCVEAAREVRSNVVCLSGDVFVNRLLATSVADALRSAGFLVYGNERVPCGDASVGYGQLAVAAARLAWHKVMPPRAGRP